MDFQHYVVVDFEATCNKDQIITPQEIIEFPAVIVNGVSGELVEQASFQTYVRPQYHPELSKFCKDLTGIQQEQVDRGVLLSEALIKFDDWLEENQVKKTKFTVVTWTNWDCRMLESECSFKKIAKPAYFDKWINLKVPFHKVFGTGEISGRQCNLKEAVNLAGLVWEGRAHCGLDDARNTARLIKCLMQRNFKFSITSTLPQSQPADPLLQSQSAMPAQPKQSAVPIQPKLSMPPLILPFHPLVPMPLHPAFARIDHCHCGLRCSKHVFEKPGGKTIYFGCGNWPTRGDMCSYFRKGCLVQIEEPKQMLPIHPILCVPVHY